MTALLITLLIGASAGILLGTAGAKIQAAAHTRLAWPQGANFLRLHLSSGFVIAVEIVTAAIALALPSAPPASSWPSSTPPSWSGPRRSGGRSAAASALTA